MKYEITGIGKHPESDIDSDGNYSMVITIGLHPTDGIAPDFSKDITVVSNNSMTGKKGRCSERISSEPPRA